MRCEVLGQNDFKQSVYSFSDLLKSICNCFFFVISSSSSCRSGAAVHIPYLLIGVGTLSFAAFRAIKARDPKAKVNQISFFKIVKY